MVMSSQSVLFLVILLCSICSRYGWSASPSERGELKNGCVEEERQALLNIKRDLYGIENTSDDLLSSWGNEEEKRDCCNWLGIRCDNKSGHVVSLDLSPSAIGVTDFYMLPALGGKINPSLFELKHITYLNFSHIDFTGSQIPSSMGTLTQLRYLSLSSTYMSGRIPPQLANLSRLEDLDLSNNYDLMTKNLEWVSHLSSLRILDMSHLNLSRASDWVQRVNQLPNLTILLLRFCFLPDITYPSSLSLVNSSTSLMFLDISVNYLSGPIFPWLFNSSDSLAKLDLSTNHLQGSIPKEFYKMTSLKYLDLSQNQLNGSIPEAFSNMTSLIDLDVSSNMLNGSIPEVFSKMNSLTGLDLGRNELYGTVPEGFGNLTALIHLDLFHNKLNGTVPEGFSKMTTLVYLDLSDNELYGIIPEGFENMISLTHLDLSGNELNGTIPQGFGNMHALTFLSLAKNKLRGSIPDFFGGTSVLEQLDLKDNMLEGEIPRSIWNVTTLSELRVGSNNLSGHLPKIMSQLKQLETFDVSNNSFQGEISHAHFLNLSKLTSLDLSSNLLSLNFHSNWTPPFQLDSILLGSCLLGPLFPQWLRTQTDYLVLNISNSGISDSIPSWFWDISTTFDTMDLSNNQISGEIGNNVSLQIANYYYSQIDLSLNQLQGPIPSFLFQVGALNLFQNRFSKFSLLCNMTGDMLMRFLDISNNELSEELPDCWSHFKWLMILILTNNKLSGRVPSSFGSLNEIQSLKLNNNKFVGELPSTLQNCTELVVLDFAENSLSGTIPAWLGKSLPNLAILSLRLNSFYGGMPNSLCHLSNMQVLDVSFNRIEGHIPNCISGFTAMRKAGSRDTRTTITLWLGSFQPSPLIPVDKGYDEIVQLRWKGGMAEFRNTLALVKSIDLSSNKLNGAVPREITELSELVSLNLSRNKLSGHIPAEIGHMKSLDALDFSWNHLVGKIPSTLAQIDRLSKLDLSNNNLSGKIPTGTQLQSFEASAYTGNAELCGDPLPKNCSNREEVIPGAADEESDELFNRGFYVSMAVGFMIVFWGVCAALIFNKTFRYAYFKLLNDVGDWVYVTTTIQKVKLLRVIKG